MDGYSAIRATEYLKGIIYGVPGLATRSVRGADRAYDCLVAGFGLSVRKERDGGFLRRITSTSRSKASQIRNAFLW